MSKQLRTIITTAALQASLLLSGATPAFAQRLSPSKGVLTPKTSTGTSTGGGGGITNPVLEGNIGNDQGAAASGSLFAQVISGVLSFVMILASLLVLLNLVQAAINWIGSGGDSGKIQKARDQMLNAIIGIILLSAAYAVWLIVTDFLGVDLQLPKIFAPS